MTGDLNLNANSLYLNTDGYQINSFSGRLQIKQATDLTPNSVAIAEYNNNENKQLHFVVNDSSDGSHNTQVVLKKNVLQLYNNTISNGSTTTGYVNIKGVADGIDTHDAVNLGQLNNAIPIGRLYSVIFRSAQQTTTSITNGLYMMVINAIFGDTVLVYDEHGNDVTNTVKERSVMAPIRAIAPGFGSLSCQTHIEETSDGKLQLDVTCILTENPGSQGFVGSTIWIGYL